MAAEAVVVFCLITWLQLTGAINTKDYSRVFEGEIFTQHHPEFPVRTLLECSHLCARVTSYCGFQHVLGRCSCFLVAAMTNNVRQRLPGSSVYVRDVCIENYKSDGVTYGTTTTPAPPCAGPTGLICLADESVMLLSATHVLTYPSYTALTTGSTSVREFSDVFDRMESLVDGAYRDGGTVYLVSGTTVQSYSYNGDGAAKFLQEVKWQAHFGNTKPNPVDALALSLENQRLIFSGDKLYTISPDGSMVSAALSTNSVNNRYRYKSLSSVTVPTNISGACVLNSNIDVVVANGDVYVFQQSQSAWTRLGQLVC